MDLKDAVSFRLDGKVALVTGGGSGIGRAIALAFAHAGAWVGVLDRDEMKAVAVAREIVKIGQQSFAVAADVSSEADVERAVAAVLGEFGGLDILVNSAGAAIRKPSVELPLADWDKVIAVNVTGTFLASRHAARAMLAAGKGGCIINVASIMGFSGGGIYPNISYQTSKGAVVNMTRALAVEWAKQGVRVNAIAPQWVNTPFIEGLRDKPDVIARIKEMVPIGRLAEPEEIAGAAVFLASNAASMVTGHVLAVDGGFLAQ
ncbi:MAG: SDR family NAD(P)-dependent oxidoreductase [Rhodospirillaceae bacterium]